MQPSEKYASETITKNGFTYKRTISDIQTLFPLNSEVDPSCSYTCSNGYDFNSALMFGWNDSSKADYIDRSLVWRRGYKSNPDLEDDDRFNNVNKITIDCAKVSFSGSSEIIFTDRDAGNYDYYIFGYNDKASKVINYGFSYAKIITDFEVNKVVWCIDGLKGITKAEMKQYLDNGVTTEHHSISVDDFIANPSNYYITRFSISGAGYWNEEMNLWQHPVPFTPCILFYSNESAGIYAHNRVMGGASVYPMASTSLGFHGTKKVELWNNTEGNTTEVKASPQSNSMYKEFKYGYILGGSVTSLDITPIEDRSALTTYCDLGATETQETTHREITGDGFGSFLYVVEHDIYKLALDYTNPEDSETSHLTSYKKYISYFLRGEKVSELLAHCGVYFCKGGNDTLNNSGATPTHMDVDEIILGEMDDSGYTTGRWIRGRDLDEYEGMNKDGSIIHGEFIPYPAPTPPSPPPTPPTPTVTAKGRKIKVILSDYSKQIKLKTPRRNCR